jgi:DNA-binding TFAR19-related protein (PDSD5 family)
VDNEILFDFERILSETENEANKRLRTLRMHNPELADRIARLVFQMRAVRAGIARTVQEVNAA